MYYLSNIIDIDELLVSNWDLETIIKMLKIDPNLSNIIINNMTNIINNNVNEINNCNSSYNSHDFIFDLINLKHLSLARCFIKEYSNKILKEMYQEDISILIFEGEILAQGILELYFSIENLDNSFILESFCNHIDRMSELSFLENITIFYNAAIKTQNHQALNFLIDNYGGTLLFNDENISIINNKLLEINILREKAEKLINEF